MRLIDADALKAAITVDGYEHFSGYLSSSEVSLLEMVTDDIDEAPTIDAVPVVRCRECKHFNMQEMECENDAISTDHEGGASYSLNFYLDDFCSYGERKEGVDNG